MKAKYILSAETHEDWRNYLIVNSFFFDVLLKKLRDDLGLPEKGLKDIQQIVKWDAQKKAAERKRLTPKYKKKRTGTKVAKDMLGIEDSVGRIVYKPIWDIIEEFSDYNLDFSLIHAYVLGDTNISFRGSSRILMVSSPADPICETGIYIKYTPELSQKDMVRIMKQASDSYQTLFKITHKSKRTHDKGGKPYIKRTRLKVPERKKPAPTKNQLKIYHAVENYLKKNYSEDPGSIKMQFVFDEVAKKLKANKSSLERSYHAVLRNFHLPTSVNTKNIF